MYVVAHRGEKVDVDSLHLEFMGDCVLQNMAWVWVTKFGFSAKEASNYSYTWIHVSSSHSSIKIRQAIQVLCSIYLFIVTPITFM